MDIRATFLPVGEELIDNVFPTSIIYIRNLGSSYDPSTGEVTENTEQFSIKAGVLSRGRTEEGPRGVRCLQRAEPAAQAVGPGRRGLHCRRKG